MVIFALILMAASAILIDYFKERNGKEVEKDPAFKTTELKHIPA